MTIKGITDEDFINYRLPSMYICTSVCDYKCDRERGSRVCQNGELAKQPDIIVDDDALIERYLSNDITQAIVFGGLEPFDQFEELALFINKLRTKYGCEDDIVIYTGYYPDEIRGDVATLSHYPNIVVKFGRYKPDLPPVFDSVLGVTLASENQFAREIGSW